VDKVIESPTIAGMAQWIEGATDSGLVMNDDAVETPTCVVPLQTSGSAPPFFCVHPAGGSPLCYVNLASHLGTDRPFLGFQSPGLFGECEPLTTVSEIASHYVNAMKAVQPVGPYYLGGWSSGGPVTFEMARTLERQGDKVALLALLDCGVMESDAGMRDRKSVGLRDMLSGGLLLLKFGSQIGVPLSYRELRMLGQFVGISLPPRLRDVFRGDGKSKLGRFGTLIGEIFRSMEILE
jgi:hypothetical protein